MKRIISLSAALALFTCAVSCVSCSKNEKNSGASSAGTDTLSITQTAYRETRVRLSERAKLPYMSLHPAGDDCFFFYTNEANKCCLAVISAEGSAEKRAELFDTMSFGFASCPNADGTFTVIRTGTDFPLEFDEAGRISNYLDFRKNGKLTFYLDAFTAEGELLSEAEIPDLRDEFDLSYSHISSLCPYGDGRYILSLSDKLVIVDAQGNVVESRNCGSGSVELTADRDGVVIACDGAAFGSLDGTTAVLPDEMLVQNEKLMYSDPHIAKGYGDFRAFIQLNEGIFGLADKGEPVLVFGFAESFVKSSDICCFASMGDGGFISFNEGDTLCLYTPYPDDYKNDRENVVVWMAEGCMAGEDPVEFAKSNDRYIVTVDANPKTLDDLVKAVLAEEGPDVIQTGSGQELHRLKNLGALADMNALMAEYGGICRDDLMPNVVEAYEENGHIYALPEAFSLRSCFAASDLIGREYTAWDHEDLYRFYAERPEGMYLTTNYCGGSFNQLAINDPEPWIDTETNICRFDSEEFVRLLKFCKDTEDSVFADQGDTADSSDTLFQKQLFNSLRDHRAMVCTEHYLCFGLSDLIRATSDKGLDLDTATIMHLPGSGGRGTVAMNGGYAVMENSRCKEGAWAYVSYLLGDERQCGNAEYTEGWNFTNKKAFEKSLSAVICDGGSPDRAVMEFTDSNGISISYEICTNATKKQAEEYRSFVLSCTRPAMADPAISGIMAEEYGCYLADEITAEECAKRIQDRVTICLSERK